MDPEQASSKKQKQADKEDEEDHVFFHVLDEGTNDPDFYAVTRADFEGNSPKHVQEAIKSWGKTFIKVSISYSSRSGELDGLVDRKNVAKIEDEKRKDKEDHDELGERIDEIEAWLKTVHVFKNNIDGEKYDSIIPKKIFLFISVTYVDL